MNRVYQINLQQRMGGGEIYTAFLTRALDQLNIKTTLLCHPHSGFWEKLSLPASCSKVFATPTTLLEQLPTQRSWVLSHGPLERTLAERISRRHFLTAIAHMPPQGRPADKYLHYQLVFGVSAYVIDGLRAIGAPAWESALYGVADLLRNPESGVLKQNSEYDWDRRKVRDRFLSMLEPLAEPLRTRPLFKRRPGITLGIVSRLTPIKQFPRLFEIVAPLLAARPEFNLEVFGSGGYASVRDLKQALRPLGDRVRFWGQQRDVATI